MTEQHTKFNYSSIQNQISVVSLNWYARKLTAAAQLNSSCKATRFKDLAIAFSNGEIHLLGI